MRNFGRVLHESGCGSGPFTPLSPRATANEHGAKTPATPPPSNGQCTGSPIRPELGSVTEFATTPKRRVGHKRVALNSGARQKGSGGRSGKKRIRSRPRSSFGNLQPQVEERLSAAEYHEQQTKARTEYLLCRESGNAAADAEVRQKAVSAGPASGLRRRTSGGGKRRQSTDGSTDKSRTKMCGKPECGWVPTAVGRPCKLCPGGVVHSSGEKLCTACHQPADENGFTHLHGTRVGSALSLLGNLQRAEAGGVEAVLRTYHPEPGQCLCQRDGCLISRLGQHEKQEAKIRCQDCGSEKSCKGGGARKVKGRWYPVAGDEGSEPAGASKGGAGVLCQACDAARRRLRRKSTSAPAPAGGGSGVVAEASSSSQGLAMGGAGVVCQHPEASDRQGSIRRRWP